MQGDSSAQTETPTAGCPAGTPCPPLAPQAEIWKRPIRLSCKHLGQSHPPRGPRIPAYLGRRRSRQRKVVAAPAPRCKCCVNPSKFCRSVGRGRTGSDAEWRPGLAGKARRPRFGPTGQGGPGAQGPPVASSQSRLSMVTSCSVVASLSRKRQRRGVWALEKGYPSCPLPSAS